MKRFYLFALLCALVLSATVNAEEKLKVYQTEIDLTIDVDVFGDGTVNYVAAENALYLNNATIDADAYNCISYSETSKNLTIYLKGQNHLSTSSGHNAISIYDKAAVTIKSDPTDDNPTLEITDSDNGICFYEGATLNLYKAGEIIFSNLKNHAIYGLKNSYLTINATKIVVETGYNSETDFKAIKCWNSLTTNIVIIDPEGTKFIEGYLVDSEGKSVKELTIVPYLEIAVGGTNFYEGQTVINSDNNTKITSGSATYDISTRTLTLESLNMDGGDIVVAEKGVTVKCIGTNIIRNGTIHIGKDVTFTGGYLAVDNQSGTNAIFVQDGINVTFDDINGDFFSHKETIYAPNMMGTLTIRNSELEFAAYGSGFSAIDHVGQLVLENSFILSPAGAYFDESYSGIIYDGGKRATKVNFARGQLYGLTVDGKPIHSGNAADIEYTGKTSENGKMSFANGVLTLNKVDAEKVVITNISEDNLKINIIGASTIGRIVAQANTTITGDNKLTLKTNEVNGAIELNEANPDPDPDKVKGVTLKINTANLIIEYTGTSHAVYAHNLNSTSAEKNKIDIYDSDIKITTEDKAPVLEGLQLWVLDRGEITKPAGAKFSKDDKSIIDKNGDKVKELTITGGEDLDIYIEGDPINSRNAEKEGFDEKTHTLTLEKAKLKGGSEPAISTGYDDLTIVLIGDNVLESKNNNVIEMPAKSSLTIVAGKSKNDDIPTLSLYTGGGKNAKGALWLNGKGSVTIEGVEIEATNDEGAGFASKSSATLTIKNSKVSVQGTEGSVVGWGELVLEGCKIVEPSGVEFKADEGLGFVNEEGKFNLTTEKVVIEVSTDGLEEILTSENANQNAKKVLYNGNIYIIKDSKMFNIIGEQVK